MNDHSAILAQLRQYRDAVNIERGRRHDRNQLASFRPYPQQLAFYAAGKHWRERLLMAGNQCGKTYAGAMEMAIHLTGNYPDWWPGHRFDRPIAAWCGSDSAEATRDAAQTNLVGPPADRGAWGTGAIPGEAIFETRMRQGLADAIDTLVVRHTSGGMSTLGFKSYDQKRVRWQGAKRDLVWFDEEPPEEIYSEGLTRTNAVPDGRAYLTFTPLQGMSEVVDSFISAERERRAAMGAGDGGAGGQRLPE